MEAFKKLHTAKQSLSPMAPMEIGESLKNFGKRKDSSIIKKKFVIMLI